MNAWLSALVGLSVPALFWIFHYFGWPLWLIGIILIVLAWRKRSQLAGLNYLAPAAAIFGVVALIMRSDLPVRLYPALVNISLLIVFALSLRAPRSIVEQIARLSQPDLPESGVRYTRKVTIAWCIFFAVNASLALATVIYNDAKIWALYNGLISYLLIGTMMLVEWLIRRKVRQHA